jgi:glycosyltransferase involved in cell wall biosynthesis
LLVEPDYPEELAKAMNYMVEHANDFDANIIRQYCIDNFSEEKIGQEIVKVYESVLCMNVT